MAKGQESKEKIFAKLMEVYPNAFFEDEGKILRVPMEESGNLVEIKITLTAAKNNLGSDIRPSAFSAEPASNNPVAPNFMPAPASTSQATEISPEEKENVRKLIESLNLQF